MKSTKFIPLIFAAVLGVACNDIIENAESISFPGEKIVLTAMREGLTPDTKSFRLDDGSVWWSPAEEVCVFYGSGSNGGSKFVSMNTAIAETVELQGSVQMSGSGKDFWAVYPYSEDNSCDGNSVTTVIPDHQTGVEGNFSNDAFPTVAKSSSLSLAFWNICGGIKFFVSRDDIKSVTIKGNSNETLAGKVKVAFGSDGTPVVQEVIDAKTEVTLNAPDGGTFKVGKYYYITLLPAELRSGITMVFETENTIGELVSDKVQTVKRSVFGILKNIDSKVSVWESIEPEWVDLGLSVKWATFNVGATRPEEYGDYFAWGETEPKEKYRPDTYKWCNGSMDNLTKYNTRTPYGAVDNKTVLDFAEDAAHINWGGNWRMPTIVEIEELINNCTSKWTDNFNETGVPGRLFTSKKAGYTDKSIFFPAPGRMIYSTVFGGTGSYGWYWSSNLNISEPRDAEMIAIGESIDKIHESRWAGMSIRPVYAEYIPVQSISLDKMSLELIIKEAYQLTATVKPSNAIAKDVRWISSDESVATVSSNGRVLAISSGTATITAYASSGVCASCEVTVQSNNTPFKAEWAFSADAMAAYKDNFGGTGPGINDTNAGDGGMFVNSNVSPGGNITYVQIDKTSLDANGNAMRIVGGTGHPFVKGPWVGDYWLFTLSNGKEQPAGAKAHIKYITRVSKTAPKYWIAEYNDGIEWKPAFATSSGSGFEYNIIMEADATTNITVEAEFTLVKATKEVQFRMRCVSMDQANGAGTPDAVNGGTTRIAGAESDGNCPVFELIENFNSGTPVSNVTLNKSAITLNVGESETITAMVQPSNASDKTVTWTCSNPSVARVSSTGKVTAVKSGSAIIVATASARKAACSVYVKGNSTSNAYEAVDLGLSVKWAAYNVGASAPEEYGDYFAWGETEPYYSSQDPLTWKDGKSSGYDWPYYKFELGTGSNGPFSKYVTNSNYGTVDNKTVLDPEDDAAHVNWDGSWRMPTMEECKELINKCTWTWTTQNGVNGKLVTGPNGKSIFLPAAGCRLGKKLYSAGSLGYYWSSSLYTDYPYYACYVHFDSYDVNWIDDGSRYGGYSVRPVSE